MRALTGTSRWRAALGALIVLGAVAACEQDDISGPVDQIGPPLLDMELAPAASAPFGGNSIAISGTEDTLEVRLSNLPAPPAGTVYQVILVDSAAGGANALVATGDLIVSTETIRPIDPDNSAIDVTEDTTLATDVLVPSVSDAVMDFLITDASIGANIAAYTHVIVAVSTTPASGAITLGPDEQRGFLSRRLTSGGSLATGTWSINSSLRRPFSIQGTGISAFVGDDLRATFERLLRPPEGFHYVAWLVDERTGINLRLGGLLTPVPENRPLDDADTESGTFLTDVAIVNSQLRAPVDVADNYTRFVLTLEPKGAGGMARAPLTEVLQGSVPTSVASRHPGAGKIYGKVTGAGSVDSTTLFLTGRGLTTPLLVRLSDVNGDFAFRTVQIGEYTLHAIPLGDSVVRATSDVAVTYTPGAAAGDSIYVTLNIP